MNKLSTLKKFWNFLRAEKKYWLTPKVFFLLFLGVTLVVSQGSVLAPFIYSLF